MQIVKEGDRVLLSYSVSMIENSGRVSGTGGGDGRVVATDKGRMRLVAGDNGAIGAMDAAIVGIALGGKKRLLIPPERGFGRRDPGLVRELPRSVFSAYPDLREGSLLRLSSKNDETLEVVVRNVSGNSVVVDANHPLAGVTLDFELTVEKIERR